MMSSNSSFHSFLGAPPSSARLTRKCRLLNRKTPYCTVSNFVKNRPVSKIQFRWNNSFLLMLHPFEFDFVEIKKIFHHRLVWQENAPFLTEKPHIALCPILVLKHPVACSSDANNQFWIYESWRRKWSLNRKIPYCPVSILGCKMSKTFV